MGNFATMDTAPNTAYAFASEAVSIAPLRASSSLILLKYLCAMASWAVSLSM
jgi:hypothetical protein